MIRSPIAAEFSAVRACRIGPPRTELAQQEGLATSNEIIVDGNLRTSADRRISAIGDCSRFPDSGSNESLRLECVDNAVDQARHVSRTILGVEDEYHQVPWFWTDQLDNKLQIAGLTRNATVRLRPLMYGRLMVNLTHP